MAFLLREITMSWCKGIAASTDLTNVNLPALGIIEAFQVGSLSAIRSMTGWKASTLNLRIESGMPKYLTG
jgi:hypothetical protein